MTREGLRRSSLNISWKDEPPAPDQAGEVYLGPLVEGKDTYLVKSREVVQVIESVGHEFWHLNGDGRMLGHWRPRFDCDCEYGLRTEYELRGFTLLGYSGRCNDMRVDDDYHWTVRVILDVRKKLDPDGPQAKALWAAVGKIRAV